MSSQSNITRRGRGSLASPAGYPISRRTDRNLSRLDEHTSLAVARVNAVAEIQEAKVDAVGAVTERALIRTAFVSQVEQLLAQTVPLATSRLQAVADAGTLGLVQTVASTADLLKRV